MTPARNPRASATYADILNPIRITHLSRMHRRIAWIFLLLTVATSSAVAKDYSVPRVVIFAHILPDGTISYQEHRTYRFDGSYSQADYNLSRAGFDEIRDIDVREQGVLYHLDNSGNPGTYRVQQTSDDVEIVWNYDARDEERTFIISYTLVGAVIRGPDHSEFFWTYVSDRWERGTDELEVNIHFNDGVDPAELLHFLRGSDDRAQVEVRRHGYRITGSNFSTDNSLAMQAIFPSVLVAEAPITHPDFSLAGAIADVERREREATEQEARRERRADVFSRLAIVAALVSLAGFALLYGRFSRNKPNLRQVIPDKLYSIPAPQPPAAASLILPYAMVSGHHLLATLFDLCRRGFYRIVQDEPPQRRLLKSDPVYRVEAGDTQPDSAQLRPWEADLVELIDSHHASGETRIKKVFDLSASKGQKWFRKWATQLKKDVDALSIKHEDNRKATGLNAAIQISMMIFSVAAIVIAGPIGAVPLATSVLGLIGTGLLLHRTPEGEELYQKWTAYQRALKSDNHHALTGSLDAHFAYAVAFGMTNRRTEAFVQGASQNDFLWFIGLDGARLSPALLGKSVSMMTSSVSSTVATGTGATAGVAGGGAGGGAS